MATDLWLSSPRGMGEWPQVDGGVATDRLGKWLQGD